MSAHRPYQQRTWPTQQEGAGRGAGGAGGVEVGWRGEGVPHWTQTPASGIFLALRWQGLADTSWVQLVSREMGCKKMPVINHRELKGCDLSSSLSRLGNPANVAAITDPDFSQD